MFKGKKFWIVGASAGIGQECARILAGHGASVAISGRRIGLLRELAREFSTHYETLVVPIETDLTDDTSVRETSHQVIQELKGLDGVLISGGAPPPGGLFDLADDDWREGIEQKLLGQIRVTRAVLPYFMAERSGRIVHLVGTHGLEPQHYALGAGVINAGLINFVKAIARYAAPRNVLINAINPGPVRTDRMERLVSGKALLDKMPPSTAASHLASEVALGRFADPIEIAHLAVWLLSLESSYCTGSYFNVDGGQLHGI